MRHALTIFTLLLTACGTAATTPDGGDGATPNEAAVADTMPPPDTQLSDAASDSVVSPDVVADTAPSCVDMDHDGYDNCGVLGPDCNDADPSVHPGATELCDGIDQNCDGVADTMHDDALDGYCARTAPMLTGVTIDRAPTCRYAHDPFESSGFSPFASTQCMEGGFPRSGAYVVRCWLTAARATDCPYSL